MSITDNHKKEAISYHALSLIASNDGINTSNTHFDYGEDICLHEVEPQQQWDWSYKFRSNWFSIAVQLKATILSNISETDTHIWYALEIKNYNDIIRRNQTWAPTPLILILYIGPNNINDWVEVRDINEIVSKKCMYYFTTTDSIPTTNTSTITIQIPKINLIQVGTLNDLFIRFKSWLAL